MSTETTSMTQDYREFRLREYEALRAEILASINEVRHLENSAVLAVVAVLAFLSANTNRGLAVSFLALLIPALGGWRAFVITSHLKSLGSHLYEIESEFLTSRAQKGWEHKVATQALNRQFEATGYVLWIILAAVLASAHLLLKP